MTATLNYPKNTSELVDFLREEVKKGKSIAVVAGAFGDMEDCEGIVEQFITPPTGGTFTKFWGCDFLFKGAPMKEIVEGLGLAKSMISKLPREIFGRSISFQLWIVFLAIFARRRLIHYLRIYLDSLYEHTMSRIQFPRVRYNKLTNELRRALDKALQEELNNQKSNFVNLTDETATKNEIYKLISDIADFAYIFIEYDNAYRLRFQDIIENINKTNVAKSVTKEVRRLFDLGIKRENEYAGILFKWFQMKKIVLLALYSSKTLRNVTRRFLLELNIQEAGLDKDDWYFCLKRRGYEFRGIPIDARLALKEEIDKAHNHFFPIIRSMNQ